MTALPNITYGGEMGHRFFINAMDVADAAEHTALTGPQVDNLHIHVSSRYPLRSSNSDGVQELIAPNVVDDSVGFFEPAGNHRVAYSLANEMGLGMPNWRSKKHTGIGGSPDVGEIPKRGGSARDDFVAELNKRPLVCLDGPKILRIAGLDQPTSEEPIGELTKDQAEAITASAIVYGLNRYARSIREPKGVMAQEDTRDVPEIIIDKAFTPLVIGFMATSSVYVLGYENLVDDTAAAALIVVGYKLARAIPEIRSAHKKSKKPEPKLQPDFTRLEDVLMAEIISAKYRNLVTIST